MGLPTCEILGLVKLNIDNIKSRESDKALPPTPPLGTKINTVNDLKQYFPDCFDGIGNFKGHEQLHLKTNATPFTDPPRRYPINIEADIKNELSRMLDLGVIRKVTGHTDWCSSITYALKHDNSLRICLDPQKLNQSLKRCPHKIPTIEEISPQLSKAKYFSKLDAKAGYWSIKLAPESQELTTFRTPIGRFWAKCKPRFISNSYGSNNRSMRRCNRHL